MKRLSIGSFILLLGLALFAQRPGEAFRLVHSDKLFLNRTETEQILELQGNVHFFYGKIEFRSNRALILDNQKIARLTGNVIVSNDTLRMQADSLAYYRNPGQMNLGGNVKITETKPDGSFRRFNADFANYDKPNDKLTTWGHVEAYDLVENGLANCGYALWDRKNGYAYMIENPLIKVGTSDTLYIEAQKIEYFEPEEKLVATFGVRVQNVDYTVSSDFLLYFAQEEKAIFTGLPRFSSDYATATAREFYLYFEERDLKRAELADSCRVDFAEEEGAGQTNWILADFIGIEFADQGIREFLAENNVSYYYQQDKAEERDYFQNRAGGQYLEAKFDEDNKLIYINMKNSIKGVYKFEAKT